MSMKTVANADPAEVRSYLMNLQTRITRAVSELDQTAFVVDAWQKPATEPLQGDGITMILEGGDLFERAGCGFSHVRGPHLPPSATQHLSLIHI